MSEFKNKVLFISGGTRGIGEAIIHRFAQEGCNIAFTYNASEDKAKAMCKALEQNYGIQAKAYFLNILEPDTYVQTFKDFDQDFDSLHYFISNAIISGRSVVGGFAPFMRLKLKGLNNIYTATVLAFVKGTQEAAKRMQNNDNKDGQAGAIITLSSTGNIKSIDNYAGHGSSKACVETMMKYAANELAAVKIRVNAISGGPIETDALTKFPNYEYLKAKIIERTPMGRIGNAADMAGTALFLCSSDSYWITGQTIIVDGGSSFT